MAGPASESDTGLDSNYAGAMAYVLGLITGVIFLVVERKDGFVRFHAMQSILVFGAVVLLEIVILSVPIVGRVLNIAFAVGVAVVWVTLIVQALKGQRYKLPYFGDVAERQLARSTSRL